MTIVQKLHSREFVVLALFNGTLVTLLYVPQGFILRLDVWQWILFIFTGLPYDFIVGLVTAAIIIRFDKWARRRHWY